MPHTEIPLTELELVGYADSLPDNVGAKTLPPVFRWKKGDSVAFGVPPLDIFRDALVNPVIVHQVEFDGLVEQGLVTLLPQKTPAAAEHLLWSDADGEVHYIPRKEYLKRKQALYDQKMADAELFLVMGDLEQARREALVALSADDTRFHPLAVLATCAFARGKHGLADAYRKDAIEFGCRSEEFDIAFAHYVKSLYPLCCRGIPSRQR